METRCVKYRIYPTKPQVRLLEQTLNTCRQTYNWMLADRELEYSRNKSSLSCYEQQRRLKILRETWVDLQNVHSQVLQNVAVRVDLAFKAFFRRVKAGENPGYPRYKGRDWYDSFTFPQAGYAVIGDRIKISKVGSIKIKLHRPITGNIKTSTIRRQGNKWYACLTCEFDNQVLPTTGNSIGIDVGVLKFAAMSDGSFVDNPRFLSTDTKALVKAQRKLSKQPKGSKERRKARKVVSRIHKRIMNRRHDFAHQLSRKLVNENDVIVVEKLDIEAMKSDISNINKSIADVAWGQFRSCLEYKAESAGRLYVAVNPAYTSQDCSSCGNRAAKPLKVRWHHCPICGLSLDRDTNAAINILRLGLQSLGVATP